MRVAVPDAPHQLDMAWISKSLSSLFLAFIPSRMLGIRDRYLLTRQNTLRLRYMTSSALVVAVAVSFAAGAFVASDDSDARNEIKLVSHEVVQDEVLASADVEDSVETSEEHSILKSRISDGIRKASMAFKKSEVPKYREVEIGPGQTIGGQLQKSGLTGAQAYRAVKAMEEYFDVRKVRSGQKIGLHYEEGKNGLMQLAKLDMSLSPIKEVLIEREEDDFSARLVEKELLKRTYGGKAKIQTSVFGSAARANIPPAVIAEVIRIYSWDVDFQRDIRQGDKIEVMYEAYETEDGQFGKYGNVLYASLTLSGLEIPIYRFKMANGRVDYFQPNGRSIKKTLMKTPVDGARISSGYGMRKHPILGYNKMHKGMDFAAPTGTPIYAAGDGVLEEVGRKGAYGKYMRIRHNSKLKTAYAHLHKYKKGMRAGKRVKQGEVIGYIGSTGRSTGPHLHYEVIVNGKQVNPRSVDLPTGEELAGKDRTRFKQMIGGVKQQYVSLTQDVKLASLQRDRNPPKTRIQ